MNAAIRASLISDAKKISSLQSWSIQDLLNIKLNNNDTSIDILNTKLLLQEIQIRLAIQHEKLSIFSKSINEYTNVAKIEGNKVQRNLNNLQALHANTYQLPHQIIQSQSILENFTTRNQKYVADTFEQIMDRHGTSVETLADVVIHARNMEDELPSILRRQFHQEVDILQNTHIESFLHDRLMIQLICEHYRSLNKGKVTGAVSLDTDVLDCVDDAITEAKHVADANLGVAPEVHIQSDDSINDDNFIPPPLIRSWLHHALVEVTKNAMTSNIQRLILQQSSSTAAAVSSLPPPVHINIDKKELPNESKFLRIQIKDQGTGLKNREQAFGFAQSSTQKRWNRLEEQQSYAAVRQPLGSLGVGLPLSRLMMRVFGGDLDVANHDKEGDGIDSGCTATLLINYDDTYKAKN